MISTKFVPVRNNYNGWEIIEVERSTGKSLGVVMEDIETQGSAECWAQQLQDEAESEGAE